MKTLRRIGCTLVVFAAAIVCARSADRPNIVCIITDDQGYGDLGYTGNPVVRTPHIDRLAAESSQLTDDYVAPTCSPTRAAPVFRSHAGVAIPLVRAALRIDGREIAAQAVSASDTEVVFSTTREAGSHRLEPVFLPSERHEVGAYYAVVTARTTR